MGLGRWLGRNSKGSELKPAEIAIQDRIQVAVDELVKGEKEFGNRTMEADEAEEILRQRGILPKGWRLRDSDSTSSGYRPTQSASKKKAALHAGILAGGSLAGGYGLAYGLGAGAASGAAGAGAAGAGGAGAAGAGAAGAGLGVGLGETAAVTGLAGSGFGAGAGLGIAGGAAGAAGAGGAAAGLGGGAGVGLGETGAVAGLGGSGLGGAAGAGGAAAGGVLPSTAAGVPLAAAGPVAGGTSSGAVAAGLGGGGSSVLGMSPSTYELIYGAAGKGLEAYGNSKQASEQRKAELLRAQMGVAADENARDPFRQQMSQIRNLGQMDLMQQMKAPAPAGPSGPYARPPGEGVQPQSYAPSPEMLQWIAQMKQNVAGGQNTAPTMTNPANYGKTSVLNLSPYSPPPTAPTTQTSSPSMPQSSGLTLEQMIALAKKQQEDQQAPQSRWQGLA